MLKLSRLICKGVFLSPASFINLAIFPISVSIPISVTFTLALPKVTRLLEYTLSVLSTAVVSPVRELSLTCKKPLSIMSPSATTISPASRTRISPTSTSSELISSNTPFLNTFALVGDSFFRLSKDLLAFTCSIVPIIAFIIRTTIITTVLSTLPEIAETIAATTSMATSKSLNCSRKMIIPLFFFAVSITFLPLIFFPFLINYHSVFFNLLNINNSFYN